MFDSGPFTVFEISRVATVVACASARKSVGAKGIEPEVVGRQYAPATPGSPAANCGAAGAPGN
jgi:hypothetical protein